MSALRFIRPTSSFPHSPRSSQIAPMLRRASQVDIEAIQPDASKIKRTGSETGSLDPTVSQSRRRSVIVEMNAAVTSLLKTDAVAVQSNIDDGKFVDLCAVNSQEDYAARKRYVCNFLLHCFSNIFCWSLSLCFQNENFGQGRPPSLVDSQSHCYG